MVRDGPGGRRVSCAGEALLTGQRCVGMPRLPCLSSEDADATRLPPKPPDRARPSSGVTAWVEGLQSPIRRGRVRPQHRAGPFARGRRAGDPQHPGRAGWARTCSGAASSHRPRSPARLRKRRSARRGYRALSPRGPLVVRKWRPGHLSFGARDPGTPCADWGGPPTGRPVPRGNRARRQRHALEPSDLPLADRPAPP
jgi:hypothetical protein